MDNETTVYNSHQSRGRKPLTDEEKDRRIQERCYKKKENPQKRGPKPRLTEEDKIERHNNLLEYHKQYYQANKQSMKQKSYTSYANNLEILRQIRMQEDPNFKPRNRKRHIINQYINQSHSDTLNMNTSENIN
jgi:hypothetical protein